MLPTERPQSSAWRRLLEHIWLMSYQHVSFPRLDQTIQCDPFSFVAVRYVPGFLPGAGFQQTAARYRKTFLELLKKPYVFTRHQMAEGTEIPSFVSMLAHAAIQKNSVLSKDEEDNIMGAANGLYVGAADTVRIKLLRRRPTYFD